MTPEEITKLAEALAKDWIEVNNLPNCLGNEVLSGIAREMERVVRFILSTHRIVERRKKKRMCLKVNSKICNLCHECDIDISQPRY